MSPRSQIHIASMLQHIAVISLIITLSSGMAVMTASSLDLDDASCDCLNWMDTYKSAKVTCGQGSEYYFKTAEHVPGTSLINKATSAGLGETLCSEFYERLNTNKCVNINMGKDEGQWCYVGEACKHPNLGGRLPGSQVSWKVCKPGKDSMLRDSTPEDLVAFSKENNVWLATLHKMAYPMSREGEKGYHLWKDVKESFGISSNVGVWIANNAEIDVPGGLAGEIAKIKRANSGYSWETKVDGRVPQIITFHDKIYLVEGEKDPRIDASNWSTLRCIGGCW